MEENEKVLPIAEDNVSTEMEEPKTKPQQTREENARFAELRRAKKEKNSEYTRGLIEGIKENSFTGSEIKDEFDLEIYQIMDKLSKEGKDPIGDLPNYFANTRRKESQKSHEEEEMNAKVQSDIDSFFKAYPDVDKDIFSNEDFMDYAEGKLGSKPLTEIYKGYTKFVKKNEPKVSKAMPSSKPSGSETKKQVKEYSDDEVKSAFDKMFPRY